jgi:hypothetical protein
VIDQDRDDRYRTLERGFNLDPDEVSGVIDSPMTIGFADPLRPDYSEDQAALANSRVDVFPEVFTEGNGIVVYDNWSFAEVGAQSIVDPTGNLRRILAPIGEKDLGHRAFRPLMVIRRCARTAGNSKRPLEILLNPEQQLVGANR